MFLKKHLFLLLISGFLIGLSSCKKEDPIPEPTTFEDGIFITNEGPFQNGTGTISFYSHKTGEVSNKIFQAANNGEELGNIVHSMTIHNGLAYIVVNNANKIVIANATDFKKVSEITGLEQPRYLLPVSNDKAFVSQWGADAATGSIKVIDLNTNLVSKTISVRPGPESMLKVNDFVYLANSGGSMVDSVVSKIDIATESVVKTIEVGHGPDVIVADKNGDLWVLGHGNYDTWGNGTLSKISNDAVTLSMETALAAGDLIINIAGDILYFVMDGMTYAHPITDTAISTSPFIPRFFYGLGIDPKTEDFVALDPKDFQQDGQILFYDTGGTVLDSLKIGVVPGNLWFY